MSIRGRIFAVTVALILATLFATGAFLEHELRQWAESRVEHELLAYARGARKLVEQGAELRGAAADGLADDLGRSFGARVTFISEDGTVLGDSEVSLDELGKVENHRRRPEVQAALAGDVGRAFRHSHTSGIDTLYVAVPYERPDGRGVVRAAMELDELETVASHLRSLFALAGVGALVLAVALSLTASHFLSRTLRTLVQRARAMTASVSSRDAAGALGGGDDELEGLAGSINALAHELELKVSTLASERDRFESVLHGLSEAVIALDGELCVTLMNTAAVEVLGPSSQATGRPLIEMIRVPDVQTILSRTLASGEDQVAEFEVPGGDARPARVVLARATRLRASEGCVLVLHDVTEVRRLEAMRREFVANVSHELRTPVSVIRANAETLLDGALEDSVRARQFLDALVRNADRLSRILADLLDLSRLEAGRYALDLEAVEIAPSVRRALEILEAKAKDKSLTLASEVAQDVVAEADPRALEQVLLNLVDNAVKYTPARGRIVVRARRTGDLVRLEVSDDGPGIEPRHRDRLFERFYRVDPGRSRDAGGTGLGLAIVKHLVESMGGRVGMDPVHPHGSTFWFTLAPAVRDTEILEPRVRAAS